jgi:hypothetical protein
MRFAQVTRTYPALSTARAAFATAALMLAGCGSEAASQVDARKVAKDIRTAAGGSATCPIASAAEVSALLGAKVEDAIAIGAGCNFNYAGTPANAAHLETGPAIHFGAGGGKPDEYQELPGIGEAAWIGRGYQNSWTAQAKRGDKFVQINVGGESGTRDAAITVLKAALAKL